MSRFALALIDNFSLICYTYDRKYSDFAKTETGKIVDIKIRIKSTVTDLALAENYKSTVKDGYFRSDDGRLLPIDQLNSSCEDVIEYTAIGKYKEENGKAVISYDEPSEAGIDNSVTSLIFDLEDRSVVTMVRQGEINSAFRFDMNERRQICSYETPFMPIEFAVNTRNVANKIKGGKGAMLLDYVIEVRGVNTERNKMMIEVRPYDAV